ncbi:MAG TPA: hypothetical protein VD996_06400 [Chitinophagaceae bacterium]|nr:hypothetical protein [Chitinophagaceae bacterium]
MNKQALIRVMMVLVITFTAAFFVLAGNRSSAVPEEECTEYQQESCESKAQGGFIIETLTRNLLGK